MLQDWERLGDLMVLTIQHWAKFIPKATLQLLREETLGATALRECKQTMELIYVQKDNPSRMEAWEQIREDRLLLREEKDYNDPKNAAALMMKTKKLHLGGAISVADKALEQAGLPWEWNPDKK